jgi:hypothetical protein
MKPFDWDSRSGTADAVHDDALLKFHVYGTMNVLTCGAVKSAFFCKIFSVGESDFLSAARSV